MHISRVGCGIKPRRESANILWVLTKAARAQMRPLKTIRPIRLSSLQDELLHDGATYGMGCDGTIHVALAAAYYDEPSGLQ